MLVVDYHPCCGWHWPPLLWITTLVFDQLASFLVCKKEICQTITATPLYNPAIIIEKVNSWPLAWCSDAATRCMGDLARLHQPGLVLRASHTSRGEMHNLTHPGERCTIAHIQGRCPDKLEKEGRTAQICMIWTNKFLQELKSLRKGFKTLPKAQWARPELLLVEVQYGVEKSSEPLSHSPFSRMPTLLIHLVLNYWERYVDRQWSGLSRVQQSYGEAFAEVVSRSVIPRSTGLGDHGKQLLHNPPPAAAHSLYYTATHTHKNSTEKKHKIRS